MFFFCISGVESYFGENLKMSQDHLKDTVNKKIDNGNKNEKYNWILIFFLYLICICYLFCADVTLTPISQLTDECLHQLFLYIPVPDRIRIERGIEIIIGDLEYL